MSDFITDSAASGNSISMGISDILEGYAAERAKGNCPFCKKPVNKDGFDDEVSRREYEITGLCLACQKETF